MHADWPSTTGYEILLEVRFEVVHDCVFSKTLLLLSTATHVIGIQNDATSEKTKGPGLHQGKTG